MHIGDSTEYGMSRFRILKLISDAIFGLTCFELAQRSGQDHWNTRSFQASLATRLRRLRDSGLIKPGLDRSSRPPRARRKGVYRWRITRRGIARLAWAKAQRLV